MVHWSLPSMAVLSSKEGGFINAPSLREVYRKSFLNDQSHLVFFHRIFAFHCMRPPHLPQVLFACKSVARFIGIFILSLAVMASALQLDTFSPMCTTLGCDVVGENDAISSHSQTLPENPVKVGCCACVRRRKDPNAKSKSKSRSCSMFKNHQNSPKRCIGAYLRFIWLDALLLLLFGVLILGLHFAPNNRHDLPLMPFWTQVPIIGNFTVNGLDLRAPVEFLYPYRKSPLSDLACAVVVTLVPIIVIGLFQLKICSVWDFNAGQIGTLKAVTTT